MASLYSFTPFDIILQAEIKGARAVFETIDTERNGFITVNELQAALTQIDPDPERAKALFDDIDQVMNEIYSCPDNDTIASYNFILCLCFIPGSHYNVRVSYTYTCSLFRILLLATKTTFTHVYPCAV